MSVVCLKLVTGEELICDQVDSSKFKNIATIIMVPGQSGQQVGLGLAPFMPYLDEDTVTIDASKIVTSGTPSREMLNNYNRIYGSGIEIASSLQGL